MIGPDPSPKLGRAFLIAFPISFLLWLAIISLLT